MVSGSSHVMAEFSFTTEKVIKTVSKRSLYRNCHEVEHFLLSSACIVRAVECMGNAASNCQG